jgi:hypothetical protein
MKFAGSLDVTYSHDGTVMATRVRQIKPRFLPTLVIDPSDILHVYYVEQTGYNTVAHFTLNITRYTGKILMPIGTTVAIGDVLRVNAIELPRKPDRTMKTTRPNG